MTRDCPECVLRRCQRFFVSAWTADEAKACLDAIDAALDGQPCTSVGASVAGALEALRSVVSAYGKRSKSTSELLPPEQQDGEIAAAMRVLNLKGDA